ncbi:MAG TPA: hypothetical protein VEU32_06640 [Burkholderiales bacterium]|nr:hypothetical protein [Burkholderiales bacterium]
MVAWLFALLLAGATSAYAQEKNWSLALGLKVWANDWSTFSVYDDPVSGTHVTGYTSDSPVAALLPTITFKYKNFFINAGYFTSGTYNFPQFSELQNLGAFGTKLVTSKATAKRDEFDINLGWQFHPRLAATIGYKEVRQKYSFTNTAPGVPFQNPFESKTTYKIPTIGLLGNAPLGDDSRLFIYGIGAWGPSISVTFSPSCNGCNTPSGWYGTAETGIGYAFSKNWLGTLGFKTQTIHQTTKSQVGAPDQVADDTTYGFIGGITFAF